MKKLFKGFGVSLMASLIICSAALAAGGAQTGDRDGSPDQDRNRGRDGFCLESTPQNDTFLLLVGNGNGTGDRDGTPDGSRDGSCITG